MRIKSLTYSLTKFINSSFKDHKNKQIGKTGNVDHYRGLESKKPTVKVLQYYSDSDTKLEKRRNKEWYLSPYSTSDVPSVLIVMK